MKYDDVTMMKIMMIISTIMPIIIVSKREETN
jgi:hypothetical protein